MFFVLVVEVLKVVIIVVEVLVVLRVGCADCEVGRVEVLVLVGRVKVLLYNYVNATRPVIGRCP